MIKIKVSYDTNQELNTVKAALQPVIEPISRYQARQQAEGKKAAENRKIYHCTAKLKDDIII